MQGELTPFQADFIVWRKAVRFQDLGDRLNGEIHLLGILPNAAVETTRVASVGGIYLNGSDLSMMEILNRGSGRGKRPPQIGLRNDLSE
jgi:hypothetical protein